MNYLTVEQVLFIHFRLLSETGGGHGLRDLGLLESAVARPRVPFDGRELYADVFHQAAALLDSLINDHPFVDGNKCTGITAAGLFLRRNGWRLQTGNAELERFTLQVARGELEVDGMAAWLKDGSVQE